MAAKLKKRALAEYSQVIQEDNTPQPVKKLKLVHKVKPQEPPLSFQGVINNEDTLHILSRFESSLPIETDHFDHCQRLLLEQYHNCKDTAVRAKIALLFGQLARAINVDVSRIVSDLMNLLKNEESHRVISQLLGALMICGCALSMNKTLHQQVVSSAVKHLSVDSHLVKIKCLQILGSLASPEGDEQPSTSLQEGRLPRILGEFTHDADSRVRTAAFEAMLKWHERGLRLEQSVFDKASQALKDDYESVRSVATTLIWVTSQIYPDRKVKVTGTDEENFLIDDGFAKICNMLNDSCVRVRAEAAALLGSLHGVSQKFLDQTLDKRLMSNMQRRVTNKDRLKESLAGGRGGFSSGRKWADDAPKDGEEEQSVAVMNMGACGAFIHGLEDEFMEVRDASIDSMCELASRCERFALQCVDSLVDMFNDEIQQVQLNAINSLRKISHVIVLREEQLDVVMGCIKAFSFDVREAFRGLLSSVKFGNRDCIRTCILGLLDLLKKYPQDRPDLWQCMTKMGRNNESFILSLAPELLSSHPYFEAVEPSITDPAYVSVLLLVFNAAVNCPSMTALFPEHTVSHYKYLRDTLPTLVPDLRLGQDLSGLAALASPPRSTSPNTFLQQTVQRLGAVESLNSTGATQLIRMGIRDLERVSELEATLAPNAGLMSMYLESHLCLSRILSNQGSSFISQIQSNTGALLKKVVSLSHQMEHLFVGVSVGDLSDVLQLRVVAQSAQLLLLLAHNTAGMKQSCIHYLQIINNFERFLSVHKLEGNMLTRVLLQNMQRLESCDPAVYHSVLLQALTHYKPQVLRLTNSVKRTRAEVLEPVVSDKTISFITGLAAAVDMIVVIEDMEDTSTLRIQVKYPDQQVHTFVPKRTDIRHLSESRHRLITKVLLSHHQWSGPCQVELSVGLAYKKQRDFTEEKSAAKDKNSEEYIQLCKPVKLTVAPKPLRK